MLSQLPSEGRFLIQKCILTYTAEFCRFDLNIILNIKVKSFPDINILLIDIMDVKDHVFTSFFRFLDLMRYVTLIKFPVYSNQIVFLGNPLLGNITK